MDFEPSAEQQMLVDNVRRFVREETGRGPAKKLHTRGNASAVGCLSLSRRLRILRGGGSHGNRHKPSAHNGKHDTAQPWPRDGRRGIRVAA